MRKEYHSSNVRFCMDDENQRRTWEYLQSMSLREPQYEALQYFDAISSKIEYRTSSKAEAEKIASENCQAPHTISVDKEFDFPSFCFDMTTGIGKSRLMGACIYYLYKTKGYKHFFILAPGNTIYDKMRREAVPGHPKYMFKGLEAEMGRPKVYDGENYLSYPVRYIQEEMVVEKTSDIQIFIFNISKIFTRGDIEFKFHKFNENLGGSFADVLRSFDDLVICMDEAHRYYAPASKKAINYLNPVLGLEYTATPKSTNKNIIYHYGLEDGAGKFLKIPVVMGRTNTAGYSDDDIEEMKLKDGIKLHERRKSIVYKYCIDNQLEQVKSMGNTSSLAELRVECNCGARRVMSGAMQKEKFAGLCCSGNHPHRPGAKAKICKKSVIPSQRGASNVYFTVTRNAISIPPWTNPINDIMGAQRATIETLVEAMGEEAGLSFAYQKYFGDKYSYEDFKAAYDRLSQNIKEFTELKEMEYAAITHHEDVEYQHDVKYFKAEEVALSESLKEYISRIIKIHRLREVRVLTGFTRLEAPEPEVDEQSHIVKLKCSSGEKWLPAVEINGEGVFIELNKEKK